MTLRGNGVLFCRTVVALPLLMLLAVATFFGSLLERFAAIFFFRGQLTLVVVLNEVVLRGQSLRGRNLFGLAAILFKRRWRLEDFVRVAGERNY